MGKEVKSKTEFNIDINVYLGFRLIKLICAALSHSSCILFCSLYIVCMFSRNELNVLF